MQKKLQNGYLDRQIAQAIKQKSFDDAVMYQNLANGFGVELNATTQKLIAQENTTAKKITRGIKSFVSGFLSGHANNTTEAVGSIVSDFTLYGDLRDIHREGSKYLANQEYDRFVLGLSMVGVGLSAVTLLSLGSSSGVKAAASTLKLAKKERVLSKGFSKVLNSRLDKSVDFKVLKKVRFSSIADIRKDSKIIAKSVHLKPIKPLLKDMRTLQKNTTTADSLHLLRYVDSAKDLQSISRLSKRYKSATKGIFKVMGKRAIRLVKGGIKWSRKLIYAAVAMVLSLLGLLFALWLKIYAAKKILFK